MALKTSTRLGRRGVARGNADLQQYVSTLPHSEPQHRGSGSTGAWSIQEGHSWTNFSVHAQEARVVLMGVRFFFLGGVLIFYLAGLALEGLPCQGFSPHPRFTCEPTTPTSSPPKWPPAPRPGGCLPHQKWPLAPPDPVLHKEYVLMSSCCGSVG